MLELLRDTAFRVALLLVVLFLTLTVDVDGSRAFADESVVWKTRWVVDAETALAIVADGAVVLDTRGRLAFATGHLPGAVRVDWSEFSQSGAAGGRLLPRRPLQRAIRKVGVRVGQPVIVVGDPPDDWGEDGRIVWMLRTVGHTKTAFVSGGIDALKRAGAELTMAHSTVAAGDFVLNGATFTATSRDVRDGTGLLIDTREAREFKGATPYGESRPGHVPGAKHLHYKALMNRDGTVKSAEQVRATLQKLGAGASTKIITYCTGGVRSAWVVAVLRSAGFSKVKNYAGSMWEWSAADPKSHPLETDP